MKNKLDKFDLKKFIESEPLEHRRYELIAPLERGWSEIIVPNMEEEVRYFSSRGGLKVLISESKYEDGNWWTHISLSRDKDIPSYRDLCKVKELFVGPDHWAFQLFPKEAEHVNIMRTCLHLFSTKANILPDFTNGSGSI